jgi:hypothetical protein
VTEREALVRLMDAAATLDRACRGTIDALDATEAPALVTVDDWRAQVRQAWDRVDEGAADLYRAQRAQP